MRIINNIIYNLAKMIGGDTMNSNSNNTRKKITALNTIRNDDKLYNYLLENKIWLENDVEQLVDFYTGNKNYFFWNNECINKKEQGFKLFHFPTASLLNEKLNNVIFKGGVELPENDRLEEIFNHNKFVDELLPKLATAINVYGGGFIKFGIDEDNNITIDVYDPLSVEVIKPARKIEEIHFINVYEKYTLKEIYGHGFVDYRAFNNENGNEVDISKIDENLKRVDFKTDLMAAMFIPGYGKNQYDKQQLLGKSKFDGLYSLFDEIDKEYSIISKEATASMTKEKYSEQSLMTISNNNESGSINVQKVKPSSFMTSYTTYLAGADSDSIPQVFSSSFNSESYIRVIEQLFNSVLQIYGISAQSLGANNSSANQSGVSKQEDEKATLDTRQMQVDKLTNVIDNIIDKLIIFNNDVGNFKKIDIKDDQKIIEFGKYKADNIEEWLNYLSNADVLDTLDLETKIEIVGKLFGFDEEKIKKITNEKLSEKDDAEFEKNESEPLVE